MQNFRTHINVNIFTEVLYQRSFNIEEFLNNKYLRMAKDEQFTGNILVN